VQRNSLLLCFAIALASHSIYFDSLVPAFARGGGGSAGHGGGGSSGGSHGGSGSSYGGTGGGHGYSHGFGAVIGGFPSTSSGYNSGYSNGSFYPNYGNYGSSTSNSDTSYHPSQSTYFEYLRADPGFSSNSGFNTHSYFWGRDYNGDTPDFEPIPDALVPSNQLTFNRSNYVFNTFFRTPQPESLLKCIARIDDELVNLDGDGRIGTLDTDFYSEELLAIKRDYDAGLSVRGGISPSREAALRKQLAGLEKDIQRPR